MNEYGTYRVVGTYRDTEHSFLVVADGPEHADQRIRDLFDSHDSVVHRGIEQEY